MWGACLDPEITDQTLKTVTAVTRNGLGTLRKSTMARKFQSQGTHSMEGPGLVGVLTSPQSHAEVSQERAHVTNDGT